MRITNNGDISLPLAVWAVHDEYDYINDETYISATSLMKPLRQIILPDRIPIQERVAPDVEEYISRALGHSLHSAVENAWTKGYERALHLLGYPKSVINRVKINPTAAELLPDTIPIYIEQRAIRLFGGYNIGGKFDLVTEGIVQDLKSTTAYTWLFGTKDDEYQLQGSLYRWLNPDKITEDFIRINFIFTDWQKNSARSNPNYPQKRVLHKDIPLLSIGATEAWISNKLNQIKKYSQLPENQIPECTDEELWRSDPVYKYYADPTKTTGRSTKNFDTDLDARKFMAEKGGKGVVIPIMGEPKRCYYCSAFQVCTQREKYFNDPNSI